MNFKLVFLDVVRSNGSNGKKIANIHENGGRWLMRKGQKKNRHVIAMHYSVNSVISRVK